MFANRFKALENYLGYANTVLAQYPISETRSFRLLNSSEPTPAANSGAWDYEVATLEILAFQDLYVVPVGYLYLVLTDTSQDGRWTIYEVALGALPGQRVLNLVQVQNYDTPLYWNYINWYLPGYNSSIQPVATVANTAGLQTLSLSTAPVGSSVKVTANGQGKFEIYLRTDLGFDRVGLEDGTIEFSSVLWDYAAGGYGFDAEVFDANYFDQEPVIETRQIIKAINEDLFIDDLLIERNRALMLTFKFIYSEFTSPNWLIKTSYIDVDHVIRGLLPYELYQPDNQTFVLDYLNEVKPYHVQTLAFNLIYDGIDRYPGALTDYDVPAYWNTTLDAPQFTSPVLTPYTYSNSVNQSFISDAAPNAQIWLERPWSDWFNNYTLSLDSVYVNDTTTRYYDVPVITIGAEWEADTAYIVGQQIAYRNNLYTVTVAGTTGTSAPAFTSGSSVDGTATLAYTGPRAQATAILRANGTIATVTVTVAGSGYLTTPLIAINGDYPDFTTSAIKLVPVMSNNLVRSINTTIKYDRYQYATTIYEWQADVVYTQGEQVRWRNRVWSADATQSSSTFVVEDWTLVDADSLSGVDRTMGFYVPTVNMPGLSLPLLIDGVDYPGVQVDAPDFNQNTGFDVGNYDINPFDNFSLDAEGRPTYDPAILDARYSSAYLDPYLGTRATDINVDGGAYVGPYSSHAPEELIPGSEFDTLDLRVYTRPGADWLQRGHGFPSANIKYTISLSNLTLSFAGLLPYTALVLVTNQTQSLDLHEGTDYTVDYVAQTITMIPGGNVQSGDIIVISAYEIGGGNQLYKNIYNGADIGDTVTVPVAYYTATGAEQIQEFVIFVNGVITTDYTYAADGAQNTTVTFGTTYTNTDSITLYVLAPTYVEATDTTVNYSWSAPQTQIITADGTTLSFTLDNSLIYVNPDSLIVTVNGNRARTAAGIRHIGDGSTAYTLPDRLGFSQSIIVDNEVNVYVDNIPQLLYVDFILEPYDSTSREVIFITDPPIGSEILIYVTTNTQCYVSGNQLIFNPGGSLVPVASDIIAVTTWNDTRQQKILSQCFVGPVTAGVTIVEPYDSTDFDVGDVTGDAGSYDFSTGATVTVNNLDMGTIITDPDRLWVSLNGRQLFNNIGFTVSGSEVILTSGLLNAADVVMITQFTNFVVPESMAFRIFQDMRGVQATYRITPETTTTTTSTVTVNADVIHVANVAALPEPNFDVNVWGVVTINAERIMYRYRDTDNNTISGLMRGTAGTAITAHADGAIVYNMGRGNLLPAEYQNYIVSDSVLANGTSLQYNAPNITLNFDAAEPFSSLPFDIGTVTGDPGAYDFGLGNPADQVEVYVAGIQLDSGFSVISSSPVSVLFDVAPPAGAEVTILVRRAETWYQQGITTASNGNSLQITETPAARFLRGL
jgi:hypothetical protein